jgi:glutamyl-tRNA reductase
LTSFNIIALTHKTAPLELIGLLHLEENHQHEKLISLKLKLDLTEFMYLSTCNRVEFIIKTSQEINSTFFKELCLLLNPKLSNEQLAQICEMAVFYKDTEALSHLFEVSSSLDSLVVGEREIITQVRKAYEFCNLLGLTGDTIRLVIKQTIETAKQVYTDTDIAKNPVSIVSLAYRQLRSLGIKNSARILFIGAGETNINMAKYLKKHQYANFTVFNRTLANGQKLAQDLKGKAYGLDQLKHFKEGFDVLITCTSSQMPIITNEVYQALLKGDTTKKVIIDMAIPTDVDAEVIKKNDVFYIDIESLKKQADENLQKREKEIGACNIIINKKVEEFKSLYQERKIELAFGEIPKQIKYIKETALNEVFSKDLDNMDAQSKEVLEKVLLYMEKKYNALAITTAKKVLLEERI